MGSSDSEGGRFDDSAGQRGRRCAPFGTNVYESQYYNGRSKLLMFGFAGIRGCSEVVEVGDEVKFKQKSEKMELVCDARP